MLLTSCDCINGTGPVVKTSRDVEVFKNIVLEMNADVFLTLDSVIKVVVEAQGNLQDHITTRSNGRSLYIDFKEFCYKTSEPVRIYISLPELSGIEVDGSGSVAGKGTFSTSIIDLDISGSGNIDVDIVADKVKADINGSGNIYLDGTSKKFKADINGSGEIRASKHNTYKAYIDIGGSGSCELFVQDYLDASISGSGDIIYKGNPEIKSHISGSGSLRKSN